MVDMVDMVDNMNLVYVLQKLGQVSLESNRYNGTDITWIIPYRPQLASFGQIGPD